MKSKLYRLRGKCTSTIGQEGGGLWDLEKLVMYVTPSLGKALNEKELALFPVPHPAFRRLQYGMLYRTASDEKLGVGLGTRLIRNQRVASFSSPQHLLTPVL